jgi:hypothetical protein
MDLVPYLSAVILIATIATLVLAVFSYAAFKLRNSRRPRVSDQAPVFFHRYRFDDEEPAGEPSGEPTHSRDVA